MLRIVSSYTQTIKMEMGLDKCSVIHVKSGKMVEGKDMLIQDETTLQRLTQEETNKH